MERVNVLKELADTFFSVLSKYEPTKESLEQFLADYQYKIAEDYDYNCHREDVINELEYCDYDINRVPDDIIDDMTDYYEEQLSDYGCDCGWHTILNNVLDYFEEDLKEYYVGEEE